MLLAMRRASSIVRTFAIVSVSECFAGVDAGEGLLVRVINEDRQAKGLPLIEI